MDSWVWLGATEGLVADGGMRRDPLAGEPLGFGYLFASHLLFDDVFVILCGLMSLGFCSIRL